MEAVRFSGLHTRFGSSLTINGLNEFRPANQQLALAVAISNLGGPQEKLTIMGPNTTHEFTSQLVYTSPKTKTGTASLQLLRKRLGDALGITEHQTLMEKHLILTA
jgi:hypothetical protein